MALVHYLEILAKPDDSVRKESVKKITPTDASMKLKKYFVLIFQSLCVSILTFCLYPFSRQSAANLDFEGVYAYHKISDFGGVLCF